MEMRIFRKRFQGGKEGRARGRTQGKLPGKAAGGLFVKRRGRGRNQQGGVLGDDLESFFIETDIF